MAAKPKSSSKRASRNGRAPIDWRSRVHKPTETDPKKRAQAIREAGSIIQTTARIDTITLGRD